MPNLSQLLKEEISRLARKEVRAEIESLKKASIQYRSDIAALKRRVAELEKRLGSVARQTARATGRPEPVDGEAAPRRFSVKGLKSLRGRLDLSAGDFGAIIGVSAQTIYNWESGATRPRAEQLATLAALRKAGKREILARQAMQAAEA